MKKEVKKVQVLKDEKTGEDRLIKIVSQKINERGIDNVHQRFDSIIINLKGEYLIGATDENIKAGGKAKITMCTFHCYENFFVKEYVFYKKGKDGLTNLDYAQEVFSYDGNLIENGLESRKKWVADENLIKKYNCQALEIDNKRFKGKEI